MSASSVASVSPTPRHSANTRNSTNTSGTAGSERSSYLLLSTVAATLARPAEKPASPGRTADAPSNSLPVRDSSSATLERLIAETYDDVRRFIATLTDPRHSEELTQETFIRAWRGLPRFAGRSSFLTWLFAIARHTVVDHYRAGAARPGEYPVADWETFGATVSVRGRFDDTVALLDLLRGLAPGRREVFVATQVEGYSYAEVARMSGLPIGTVRSRVARARVELAEAVRSSEAAA